MTIAKAQQVIPILLGAGLFPRIIQNPDQSITLAIQDEAGVDSLVMKNFADAQQLSVKGKIIIIT